MSTAPASRQQIGAIHAAKSRAGLDEDSYRDMLRRETGQITSKSLTSREAGRVLDYLRGLPSRPDAPLKAPSKAGKAIRLDGTYAGKLRALWITGYNLGVVEDRSDKALLAFCERQTGIAHPNWWRDAAPAQAAIEGLKAWIGREAGVDWSRARTTRGAQEAAYHALRRRLIERRVRVFMPADTSRFEGAQFIEWMRVGGEQLRAVMGERE